MPVPFARIGPTRVAVESAFCAHLKQLRGMLAPRFTQLTVAAPFLDGAARDSDRLQTAEIDEERDGIRCVRLFPAEAGRAAWWFRHWLPTLRVLRREVRRADLVHAGISHNVQRPIEFTALLMALRRGKRTICIQDIDLRREARMNYRTGRWSLRVLLVAACVYDPLRSLQLRIAARRCSLVLMKSRRLVADYGGGRPQVKYFLNPAYSTEHLIDAAGLEQKLASLDAPEQPLELVYVGRLTAYKGVDRSLEAFARAAGSTRAPMRLTILGAGEEAEALEQLATRLGVRERVVFREPLPFGPEFFEALRPLHLLLATPLSEDTPRSALDALASGLPVLAFATEYYADLAQCGAVDVVPWPSVERLAERIVHYAEDKRRLAPRARAGVEFARANAQDIWLAARVRWTLELFEQDGPRT